MSNKNTKKNQKKPPNFKSLTWYLLLSLVIVSIISASFSNPKQIQELSFTEFLSKLNTGQITEVIVRSREQSIIGKTKDGLQFKSNYINYPTFFSELQEKNIKLSVNNQDSTWVWGVFLQFLLPILMIGFLWFFIFRQAQGANSQAMSFGKAKTAAWKKKENVPNVTFKDIAGANEAVEELKEIVDFLKAPKKYKALGAKIPKGALMMGSPGTGKTLLAKAVAGEASVPFFNISGSDFVEMFVGVGASRVRDLFQQAKKVEPAIIFVDEIDAVGRYRGAGLGGGHDEREQTLNQLLVEMDGFQDDQTVIVIAATNRPDILDPALLRPGRFDRQITVDKPDISGREEILAIHAKNKKLAKHVDLSIIARATSGFTGADLANLLNESALLAARKSKTKIDKEDVEESIERVVAGPQRKSRVMSEHEKRVIAFHEIGHAYVAALLPEADPVHKVSILPRGMALGYTLQLPEADRFLVSKTKMKTDIQVLLAGRIVEEVVFNEITSGASNDIERATNMARSYVCQYGFSNTLKTIKYGKTSDNNVFLGKQYSDTKNYSDQTAHQIDQEILSLINACYDETKKLIVNDLEKVTYLSETLLEKEIIEKEAFLELIQNGVKKTKEIQSTTEV